MSAKCDQTGDSWWNSAWQKRASVWLPEDRDIGGQWVRLPFTERIKKRELRFILGARRTPLPHWTQTVTMTGPFRIAEDPEVHYGFPRIIRAKNGDLLLFYRIGVTHADDPSTVCMRVSSDDGRSWSQQHILWEPDSGVGAHNPVAMVADDGRVILWISRISYGAVYRGRFPCVWSHSDDHGKTWASFEYFDTQSDRSSFYVTDTIRTNDGWIAALTTFPPTGVGDAYTNIWRSRNDGRSWAITSRLTDPGENMGDEVAFIRTNNDRLLCLLRGRDKLALYRMWSNDEGHTWTSRQAIEEEIGCAVQRPRLTRINKDILFLTGRDAASLQVVAYISRDDGQTFGERHILEAYQRDGGYTDTVVLFDERVLIIWYSDKDTAYCMPDIKQSYLHLHTQPEWIWIRLPQDASREEGMFMYYDSRDAKLAEERISAFCRPESFHLGRLETEK